MKPRCYIVRIHWAEAHHGHQQLAEHVKAYTAKDAAFQVEKTHRAFDKRNTKSRITGIEACTLHGAVE